MFFIGVLASYEEICQTLDRLDELKLDAENRALGIGLQQAIKSRNFAFLLVFLKDIFDLIMPVEVILQKRELGYQASKPLIDKLLELIEEKRQDDVFPKYIELSTNILPVDEEIAEPLRRKRRCVDATTELRSGCIELLDIIIHSIKSRFTENDDILRCLSAEVGEMTVEILQPMKQILEIPDESELIVAKNYLKGKDINEAIGVLSHMKEALPTVFRYFCAVQTFGNSTAICECSFSAVSRVQTVRRLSMTNKRLSDLALLAFENGRVEGDAAQEEILRHFNDKKTRKMQLY